MSKTYRAGKTEVFALRGVTFAVGQGEFISIMGPSGSGKSTLLNILGCLDQPSGGHYILRGESVEKLSDRQLAELRNRELGFVFQSFHLLPRLTAVQNVELPLVYRGVAPRERRQLALEALARMGLDGESHRRPSELSGGQQQRVAIARAIVGGPHIILADEPTGNLDSRTGHEIMQLFQQLNAEKGMTIILVTHDPTMSRYARRVIRLRDGLVVEDEPVTEPITPEEALAAQTRDGQPAEDARPAEDSRPAEDGRPGEDGQRAAASA